MMELGVLDVSLFIGLIAVFLTIVIKRIAYLSRLPPGPWGYPGIGSIINLNRTNALKEFEKYKKKYGPIFSVGVGRSSVIVINGYKTIQEALKVDALNGRPDFEMWKIGNGGIRNRGILSCDANSTWHEQRRFALRNLRDFGFGKQSMEGLLLFELEQLIQHIKKDIGKPVCPKHLFNASVLNSLWSILTGHRFDLDDSRFHGILDMFAFRMERAYIVGTMQFLELFCKVFQRKAWNSIVRLRQNIFEMMKTEVQNHAATYQEGLSRDFIDVYLKQRNADADSSSSFTSGEGMMNLVCVLKDLFHAGTETTSTTLFWAVLHLVKNPEVQLKVQAEIDAVIERKRLPSRDDKHKLLYFEAFLNEVHRSSTILPVSVYHKVMQDTEFEGHFFPKDAVLFMNIHDAHHNRDYWTDPECFRPERFLNDTGTALIKHEPFMPFSNGKRMCLGEPLARDTLFLFLVGLLQNFTFKLAPEWQDRELRKDAPTFVTSPNDFKVIITERG